MPTGPCDDHRPAERSQPAPGSQSESAHRTLAAYTFHGPTQLILSDDACADLGREVGRAPPGRAFVVTDHGDNLMARREMAQAAAWAGMAMDHAGLGEKGV